MNNSLSNRELVEYCDGCLTWMERNNSKVSKENNLKFEVGSKKLAKTLVKEIIRRRNSCVDSIKW